QTQLDGTVVNRLGELQRSYSLVIWPADLPKGTDATRWTHAIKPDQRGHFEIDGLPRGRFLVAAFERFTVGDEWDPAIQKQSRSQATTVVLREGEHMTVTVRMQ